jgi:hypothetical protein
MTMYDSILDDYLSKYYQTTVMGLQKYGTPTQLVDDYVALGTQDPEFMIKAGLKLNSLVGIDDEHCFISKNHRDFLQKVVSSKGAAS